MRKWQKVKVAGKALDNREHTVEYQVLPDYLAVGNDDDWVRMPMTPQSAQAIAEAWLCTLPTMRMVAQTYDRAAIKLAPIPIDTDAESPATFLHHQQLIDAARGEQPLGPLVAGVKKDIVLTNKLISKKNSVALFGWHQLDGKAIEALNVKRLSSMVDYSHGIRLVRQRMLLDGEPTTFARIVGDKNLAPLLTDEQVLIVLSY